MKKLYVGYTQYQLLIFLLLKDKNDKVTFILPKYLEKLGEKLKKNNRVIILEQEKPQLKKIFQFLNYYKYIKKLIKNLNISEDTILYGDSIINYIISDNNILCRLEDGFGNYNLKIYEDLDTLKKKIYFFIDSIIFYIFFRKKLLTEKEKINKRIDKFYATEMAPTDLWFENIIERISIKKLWQEKNENEKNEILKIFNVNEESLKKINNNSIIVFTQPLSEDGIISEKEKIEIYKKILENYPKDDVIIKRHPREKTNYKKIFPGYKIIEEQFPAEFLLLQEKNIKKVVTVYSSAILIFKNVIEIDFYGTEINQTLFNKMGSCDNIYKKNK